MTFYSWGLRKKQLKYRDFTGADQSAHQAHWAGFEWEAGNVIVAYTGPHGCIQVWAASEAEGRRVIEHACSVAGIDPSGGVHGEWIVTAPTGSRNGKGGRFRTAEVEGHVIVTKREGPDGPVAV